MIAYPNPFNAYTTINFSNKFNKDYKLDLFDAMGKHAGTFNPTSSTQFNINRNNLGAGQYHFIISSDEEVLGKGNVIV